MGAKMHVHTGQPGSVPWLLVVQMRRVIGTVHVDEPWRSHGQQNVRAKPRDVLQPQGKRETLQRSWSMEYVQVHPGKDGPRQMQDHVHDPGGQVLELGEIGRILAGQQVVEVQHHKRKEREQERENVSHPTGFELRRAGMVQRALQQNVRFVEQIVPHLLGVVQEIPYEQRHYGEHNADDAAAHYGQDEAEVRGERVEIITKDENVAVVSNVTPDTRTPAGGDHTGVLEHAQPHKDWRKVQAEVQSKRENVPLVCSTDIHTLNKPRNKKHPLHGGCHCNWCLGVDV